ncbi:8839_t:CDS:2 [Gigaspora margarita]|uniref:8839_t:CDS:1 n=1 Tax=Gigaspora margarita TaxID=4874 RepID=A0ABM8VWA7_GIGMA|nr:8839_t:CDS:2 [Gigaspora margarita]
MLSAWSMIFVLLVTGADSISTFANTIKINEGISIEILDFNATGYIIFKVDAADEQNITNIVLWGETIIAQSEQHVGSFAPIVDHAYVYGCNGYPNSTITNYDKPVNNHKKHNHHSHKKHNHHRHKKPIHHNKEHNHHNDDCTKNLNDGHKNRTEPESNNNNNKNVSTPFPNNQANEHINSSNYSSLPLTSFQFKGVAMLANNPNKIIVFSSDTMYIRGNIPFFDSSLNNDTLPSYSSYSSPASSSASFNHFKSFGINLALLVLLVGIFL